MFRATVGCLRPFSWKLSVAKPGVFAGSGHLGVAESTSRSQISAGFWKERALLKQFEARSCIQARAGVAGGGCRSRGASGIPPTSDAECQTSSMVSSGRAPRATDAEKKKNMVLPLAFQDFQPFRSQMYLFL